MIDFDFTSMCFLSQIKPWQHFIATSEATDPDFKNGNGSVIAHRLHGENWFSILTAKGKPGVINLGHPNLARIWLHPEIRFYNVRESETEHPKLKKALVLHRL